MRRRRHWAIASVVLAATVFAACSSSTKSGAPTSTSASSGAAYVPSTAAGVGVTPTSIKVGISLVDFTCIKQFVDSIRVNQDKNYQAYIDDINQHGGINGRKIVPVYHTFCPIGNAQAISLCTKFTEDDKVFAVLGNFVDFSGDAQTCLAKQHKTVLMTFQLTQAIMNQSPPGMIILPGTNPERSDAVVLALLKKQHTLDGKTVAVLGETTSQQVVKNSVEPGLKKRGVKTGTTAILSISGSDTTAAQGQLDSFVERWKTEHVDAVFVSGTQVASQQFVEKLRADMPGVILISDISDVLSYGQQETTAGRKPNPYEGIIIAGGPTAHEYDQSANWAYCSTIWDKETGKVAPNAEAVVPGPDGKTLDTYGSINDACQILSMFHDIATRAGKYLNDANWVHAADTYGAITNRGGGQYASLHSGKYDVDDTFRLEEFDSSIPPKGNWKPITPLQNISGS
jgi:ABC-type branched-subunit amino acid transport system substrate-binding protein